MFDSLKGYFNEELKFHIRCLSHIVYYVTEEEDLFLLQIKEALGAKYLKNTKVWSPTFGLHPIANVISDWENKTHTEDSATMDIHRALTSIYKDNQTGDRSFYIITDADRYMNDPQVVRRFLNIIHQLNSSETTAKIVILVSSRLVVPAKLTKYVEVVHDKGLPDQGLKDHVDDICKKLDVAPPVTVKHFKGLNASEVEAAIAQSVVATKTETESSRIDFKLVSDYKRRQLKKTDLLTHVSTDEFSFDVLGGVPRFKKWAEKTKANWTEAGREYGLRTPKGVIALGAWGCGKSLAVKALANAWGMPLIQFELGKLRQSGVGDSESNVYKALSLVETVSPCILWADEADKSFSGSESSALTDSGTTSRMIGIISTWMQETNSNICLAMTANKIGNVPPEFIRRANHKFFFDLPSEDERIEIIKIHLRKQRQDPSKFQLADLADASAKMVGSEIEQSIEDAMTDSFHEDKDHLDQDILLRVLKSRPRIFKTLGDDIKDMRTWVGYDANAKDGVRASLASEPSEEQVRFGT